MRIDKLLWFLRLAKTRPIAQALAEEGHIRLNGRRIDRAHQKVVAGDILTIPMAGQVAGPIVGPIVSGVRVIEVLSLPERRGPSSEAQGCYRVLDGRPVHPIAAPQSNDA